MPTNMKKGETFTGVVTVASKKAERYVVKDGETGDVLMIAPMKTIQEVFRLHRDAVARVANELQTQADTVVHFNGRPTAVTTSGSIVLERF